MVIASAVAPVAPEKFSDLVALTPSKTTELMEQPLSVTFVAASPPSSGVSAVPGGTTSHCSVPELHQKVTELQQVVSQMLRHDWLDYDVEMPPPFWKSVRKPFEFISIDDSLQRWNSLDRRRPSSSSTLHRHSSPYSCSSPYSSSSFSRNRSFTGSPFKDDFISAGRPPRKDSNASTQSEMLMFRTPEKQHRDGNKRLPPRTAPHTTRFGALTRENVSLLPIAQPPTRRGLHHPVGGGNGGGHGGGSVCGSQKSRTSVRTDGGAVFSRLYQPDFYQKREERLRILREKQEHFTRTLQPVTLRRSRDNPQCGGDSNSQCGSVRSCVSNVSSRLYDPDYLNKRAARLEQLRKEQEVRECTFRPSINANDRRASRNRRL